MMATIERYLLADGKTCRYRVRYRTADRRQTDKRGFHTKKAAERFASSVEVSIAAGAYVSPTAGRITVGELYGTWAAMRYRPKASTRAKGATTWNAHLSPQWSTVPIVDIQPTTVQTWVATMAGRGLQAATIENALGQLRMILDSAVADRRIVSNPCLGIRPPRRKHNQRGYLTHHQVAALADSIRTQVVTHRGGREIVVDRPDLAALVCFLAYTGLRWGEMAALKVGSFDMLRRRVSVTEAVAEVRGELVLDTTKNHERRSVPFPAFLTEPLAALMLGKAREDMAFTGPKGAVMRVSGFRPRLFAPAVARCRAADPLFPLITPHDLRHTAASLAISAGANAKAVQTMLGHKSAAMTLDVYADLFPDDLDAVAVALDQAVSRQSVGKMWARNAKEPAPKT